MGDLNQRLMEFATSVIPSMGTATTIAIVVTILIALFYCFFGYKFLRVHISFVMFFIGAVIGMTVGVALKLDQKFILALIFVAAILLALLGFFLYKVGLFILIFMLVLGSSYGFLKDVFTAKYLAIGCVVVSILFALIACFFVRPFVIIFTALSGGLIVSNNLIDHFLTQVKLLNPQGRGEYIVLGFALILAVFGMIFQFRTTENYEEKRTRKKSR